MTDSLRIATLFTSFQGQAVSLRKMLAADGIEIRHGQALDRVARLHGLRDWEALQVALAAMAGETDGTVPATSAASAVAQAIADAAKATGDTAAALPDPRNGNWPARSRKLLETAVEVYLQEQPGATEIALARLCALLALSPPVRQPVDARIEDPARLPVSVVAEVEKTEGLLAAWIRLRNLAPDSAADRACTSFFQSLPGFTLASALSPSDSHHKRSDDNYLNIAHDVLRPLDVLQKKHGVTVVPLPRTA